VNDPGYQPSDMTLWPCPRCKSQIPSTSVFCPNCGLPLGPQQQSTQLAQPAKKQGNPIVGLLALLVVGAGAWYFFSQDRSPSAPFATARPGVTAAATLRPAGPTLTRAQQNARESAESYLAYTAFSRTGLIDQLVFEEYSRADATVAVDSLNVNWREQAYKSAKSYLEYSSFSLNELIDQLEYEGFSTADASYGANRAYNE